MSFALTPIFGICFAYCLWKKEAKGWWLEVFEMDKKVMRIKQSKDFLLKPEYG